jgi:macrolide transport system ATP-binding/permease protein
MDWRFWRWTQRDNDLDDEIAHDLAADAEERVRCGIPREEAALASRRDFGNVTLLKEDVREVWIWASLNRLSQDVRYGWRTLRSNLLFTSMAVVSLALGIGANTAIYSVMDAVMLRALPVKNAGELAILNWRTKNSEPDVVRDHYGPNYPVPGGGVESPDFPWQVYELFRNRNNAFSTLFAHKDAGRLNLVVKGQAEAGPVEFVSGNFFSALGVNPAAGRLLDDDDNLAGSAQVAVISFSYWRKRFNADPSAIGETLELNNIPFTIAGVAPPEFYGVSAGSTPLVYISMFNRLALFNRGEDKAMFIDPHNYWVEIMGRLRPGVTLARAETELSGRFHQYVLASAANDRERKDLPSLWVQEGGSGVDSLRRQFSKPILVLMAMVALILAIACANIANLLLSRSVARRREIAVRLSLGASRLRVFRQLLTESLMLSLPGGVIGIGVAAVGIRFLLWLLSGGGKEMPLQVGIDYRVLVFTLSIALTTGLVSGIAPAIQATRVDITPALKETRASSPRRRSRSIGLGQLLVTFQIALSLVLVLGATLFVRTLANLRSVEVGFNPEHLLTFSLDAKQAGYKDAQISTLYARLTEQFRALPGVRAASVSSMPLVAQWTSHVGLYVPGIPKHQGRGGPGTSLVTVGPTFFETMQLPMVLGRSINAHDVDGVPLASVVNQTFANKYFPNQNPIGRQFGINSDAANITIVGVAKNARYSSLKDEIPPVAYLAYFQNARNARNGGSAFFELRTVGDPLSLAQSVRAAVHAAAPQVPLTDMLTQTQIIDRTITQERTFADLCSAFAVLALVIAGVGLYGTMAYAVSRRTNEIGIRMALGAERRRIIAMVLREVLALAVAGLAFGLMAAWSTLSIIKSFLFGIKATDPVTVLWASAILFAALILAGYTPAHRASRIEPLSALRHE